MVTRRRFIIGMSASAVALLTPDQSYAFIPVLFGVGRALATVTRAVGYVSRGSRAASTGMRASSVYRKSTTKSFKKVENIPSSTRSKRLSKTEKNAIKTGLRKAGREYLEHLAKQDQTRIVENTANMVDSADNLNDVNDLVGYACKYDNNYGAVFTAARDELNGNSSLRNKMNNITSGADVMYATLVRDEALEDKFKRASRAFLTL